MDQFLELPLSSFALTLAPWILIPSAIAAAWAGVTRRSRLAAVFLVVTVLAVVGPLFLSFAEARARTTDGLVGTSWAVVEVDGDAVPDEEMYLFLDTGSASLVTHIVMRGGGLAPRCRESVSELDVDTEHRTLRFTGFEDVRLSARTQAACDASLSRWHDRVAAALRVSESWQVTADTMELTGTSRVVLEKVGRDYD